MFNKTIIIPNIDAFHRDFFYDSPDELTNGCGPTKVFRWAVVTKLVSHPLEVIEWVITN